MSTEVGTVLSDVPLLFKDKSSFGGGSNASTGQAEDERLGFSEYELQDKCHARKADARVPRHPPAILRRKFSDTALIRWQC